MATGADTPLATSEIHSPVDPFVATPVHPELKRHRYSSYDNNLFTLYSDGSPAQAKRALQAHLAETDRRLQEASELGTSLVSQREQLSKRLKEVERQKDDSEIGPELRQKLKDLEREFHEVGKETARVFIPKVQVNRAANVDSAESGAVYEREAQHSPSKVHAPSRKQRNQAPSRINDIKLATEISTSLLNQIRDLQAILSEKDDALKAAQHHRSQLEVEFENLGQRIRAMDESEQRYKDENWTLETQIHEMMANQKESTEREQRLLQQLSVNKSERSTVEKDYEDLKSAHGKLSEDHASSRKTAETQFQELRKRITDTEIERGTMQRKIDELQNQNQEFAKAIAYRAQAGQQSSIADVHADSDNGDDAHLTPEQSPPPSPSKATPRHGHLESETLKSSLHHAHRMIQNLKNNIHREKTEKIELKRMLQETRAELENRRSENGPHSAGKRRKTAADKDLFKKPARPDRLGAARSTDILINEDWEDHDEQNATPSRKDVARASGTSRWIVAGSFVDAAHEATETSDAFDTAHERDTSTETEAFQTGAETLDGNSSDELTETENNFTDASRSRAARQQSQLQRSESYNSTASTSASEDELNVHTPVHSTLQNQQRYRLRVNRGANNRKSVEPDGATPPSFKDSPLQGSAVTHSNNSTPAASGRNLAAELASFSDEEGSEVGSYADGTPSRSRMASREVSPELTRAVPGGSNEAGTSAYVPSVPPIQFEARRKDMIDIGVMTETPVKVNILEEKGSHNADVFSSLGFSTITAQHTEPVEELASDSVPIDSTTNQMQLLKEQLEARSVQFENEAKALKRVIDERTALAASRTDEVRSLSERLDAQYIQTHQESKSLQEEINSRKVLAASRADEIQMLREQMRFQNDQHETVVLGLQEQIKAHEIHNTGATKQVQMLIEKLNEQNTKHHGVLNQLQDEVERQKALATSSALRLSEVERVRQTLVQQLETSRFTQEIAEQKRQTERQLSLSPLKCQHTEPFSPPQQNLSLGTLAMSSIISLEVEPVSAASEYTVIPNRFAVSQSQTKTPVAFSTMKSVDSEDSENSIADRGGVLRANTLPAKERREPFKPVTGNARDRSPSPEKALAQRSSRAKTVDEGTQTGLTSDEIDGLLRPKNDRPVSVIAPLAVAGSDFGTLVHTPGSPTRSVRSSKDFSGFEPTSPRSLRRPGSSGSVRHRPATPPPLPTDHRQLIEAASKRESVPPTPTLPPVSVTSTSMPPPPLPVSTHRRSVSRTRTPTNVIVPISNNATTPRPRHGTVRSQSLQSVTRRSSVSSFASELDQRFNIGSNVGPGGFDPNNTDPRMIQAITQTMIGEYLWKYTRKAGRGDISENRHRRFFWVHPYTRTLYWSDQDPATAGRAQMKAKSVAIEAVRVVTDDNPMPPGLHRKSLIVVTPSRNIKFTATTGQRHETWFNALSYLLLRTAEERVDDNNITAEDVDEFNPRAANYGRSISRTTGRSRVSLSSYNSRTTRQSSPYRVHHEVPTLTPRRSTASIQGQIAPSSPFRSSGTITRNTIGRVSSIFRPGVRGSYASSRSRQNVAEDAISESEIYQASVVNESAEELRRVIETQERDADRLENVRACCDGKHDVGSLSRNGRHASHTARHSHSMNMHKRRASQT